jgi:hypothetical protein
MESFVECELWPGYRFGDQGTIIGMDGRPLKPSVDKNKYHKVTLCVNKLHTYHLVHRLIAIAFKLPNPDNKPTIDHINRDRGDNRLENLRWADKYEQQANRGMCKTNTSGVKGLSIHPRGWQICLTIRGDRFMKCFKTRPEAEAFLEEISRTH